MVSNIDFIITTLCIVLCIVSFGFGYYFASTRAETRFYKAMERNQRMREMSRNNTKVVRVDENQLPPDFLKFLEAIEKEVEEEEKNDGK